MQIQIGLALGIFKDPQTKKLFNHFIGNFLVSVSATPISTRNPLSMLPVTSPSTFTSACCTRCITNRICLLLSYVFLFLIFFILLEISLIFDLMIPLQPGIQLMESFLINILQIRVLYSLYRQILFRRKVLTTALIAA